MGLLGDCRTSSKKSVSSVLMALLQRTSPFFLASKSVVLLELQEIVIQMPSQRGPSKSHLLSETNKSCEGSCEYSDSSEQTEHSPSSLCTYEPLIREPHLLTQPPDPDTCYLYKVYRCMLYMRKEEQRTSIDDGILLEQLHPHICMGSVPVPKDQLGARLLTDGYTIAAFAVLMSRLYRSTLLLGYIMGYADNLLLIYTHQQEFREYMGRDTSHFSIPQRIPTHPQKAQGTQSTLKNTQGRHPIESTECAGPKNKDIEGIKGIGSITYGNNKNTDIRDTSIENMEGTKLKVVEVKDRPLAREGREGEDTEGEDRIDACSPRRRSAQPECTNQIRQQRTAIDLCISPSI